MPGRQPGPHAQTVRALRMFLALERKPIGYQLVTLAEEFAVSERQVRRDVAAMAAAGIDVDVYDAQVRLRASAHRPGT